MNWTHTRLAVNLSAFAVLLLATNAGAQTMGYGPPGAHPGYGAVPAQQSLQPGVAGSDMYVQWGVVPGATVADQAVQPAGLNSESCGGEGDGSCGSCGSCRGRGCDSRGGSRGGCAGGQQGILSRCLGLGDPCGCNVCNSCRGIGCGLIGEGLFGRHGPWPEGDGQFCYPRWWDVSVEAIWLKRENMPTNLITSTFGPVLVPDPTNTALETDDLGQFDYRPGFRLNATKLVGPGTNLEVGYFGAVNWSSSASVQQNDGLWSVLSGFGQQNLPFGFLETDVADYHEIQYSSDLNSLELNLRRRFISPDCWLHTSALMGIRYLRIEEDFAYRTRVSRLSPAGGLIEGGMDYTTKTKNDLIGYQLGGDAWACLLPAWKFGGDMKAGVYGNHARQKTFISTGGVPLEEADGITTLSFAGEANLWLVYHITSRMTLRGGYQFLYVDSLALASENFNTAPPAVLTPAAAVNRVVDVNSDGFGFYHGFNFGYEWTW